ncbi:MAG: transcription antitermination factor NusB, partial [Eubacteriales bacterium]|nr:transcription antitermination factor NusB [Eubacteriales bacterium]
MNVREAALNSLIRCEKDGRYSNLELDSAIKKYNLTGVDRAFFTALVYGVIERRITLDYITAKYSHIPLDKL